MSHLNSLSLLLFDSRSRLYNARNTADFCSAYIGGWCGLRKDFFGSDGLLCRVSCAMFSGHDLVLLMCFAVSLASPFGRFCFLLIGDRRKFRVLSLSFGDFMAITSSSRYSYISRKFESYFFMKYLDIKDK